MRSPTPLLLLLLLVVVAAVLWALRADGDDVVAPPGTSNPGASSSSGSNAGPATPDLAVVDEPARTSLPDNVTATRVAVVSPDPGPLADRATAVLRVIDHETERPVPGAIVRAVQTGADLAFSDEQGLAPVPLEDTEQLAVLADGYLLRRAPTRLGSTEAEPQDVRMVADRFSMVRRFEFVVGDQPVSAVCVRLRPVGGAGALQAPRADADPVLRRAWQEHTSLAASDVARDVAVQLGTYNEDRVHVLPGGDRSLEVRFLQAGSYELHAAAVGLVALARVDVAPGAQPPAQRITMTPGAYVDGRVLAASGAALPGAEVSVQGGDPLGLVATSDENGRFTIGPLLPRDVTLLVRHGLHEPVAHGPVDAVGDAEVVVRLRPLAGSRLTGRVRARPGLQPIAGARVIWQVPGGASIVATTGADGGFELVARGDVATTLRVQAEGHVPYAELVAPDAPARDYDLLPADPDTRVAAGMTAMFAGVVFDRRGAPLEGAAVRWRPDDSTPPAVPPNALGRRILNGHTLELPGVTTTGSDGSFRLETTAFGAGTIVLEVDLTAAAQRRVDAVAGRVLDGLELRIE